MKKHLIDLPNGDVLAGELLMGVNYFPGSGIALKGHEGASLGFLKTVDEDEGLHWRDQLVKIIKGIHSKRPYTYRFELPKKDEKKVAEDTSVKK